MFLAEHSDFEVPFVSVTAHFARELQHRIETARDPMRNATAEAIEVKRHRDSAEKELRHRMRNVRLLLSVAVRPSDRGGSPSGSIRLTQKQRPARIEHWLTHRAVKGDIRSRYE